MKTLCLYSATNFCDTIARISVPYSAPSCESHLGFACPHASKAVTGENDSSSILHSVRAKLFYLLDMEIDNLSAWNLILCGIATLQVVLVKYVLNHHIRRPNKIAWIIADKTLLRSIAMGANPPTNHMPRLQRNRCDHASAHIRTAPSPCCREELLANLEIRMLHCLISPKIADIECGVGIALLGCFFNNSFSNLR